MSAKSKLIIGVTVAIVGFLFISNLANRDNTNTTEEPNYTQNKVFDGVKSVSLKGNATGTSMAVSIDGKDELKATYHVIDGSMNMKKLQGEVISKRVGRMLTSTVYNADNEIIGEMIRGNPALNGYEFYDYSGRKIGSTQAKVSPLLSQEVKGDNGEVQYKITQNLTALLPSYQIEAKEGSTIPIEFVIYTALKHMIDD